MSPHENLRRDKKFRHKYCVKKKVENKFGKHEPEWVTIRGLKILPDPILALAEKLDAGKIESHYLTWKNENFVPLLEEFSKLREKEIDAGESSYSKKTINN